MLWRHGGRALFHGVGRLELTCDQTCFFALTAGAERVRENGTSLGRAAAEKGVGDLQLVQPFGTMAIGEEKSTEVLMDFPVVWIVPQSFTIDRIRFFFVAAVPIHDSHVDLDDQRQGIHRVGALNGGQSVCTAEQKSEMQRIPVIGSSVIRV